MADSEFNIAISNYAGVPLVELVGEVNKRTLVAVNEVLGKLASAGHYNVMVNVKHAAWRNLNSLLPLRRVARLLQAHYGILDLIAEADQIVGLHSIKAFGDTIRFHTSEGQALTRIRRLPAAAMDAITPMPAHLSES